MCKVVEVSDPCLKYSHAEVKYIWQDARLEHAHICHPFRMSGKGLL